MLSRREALRNGFAAAALIGFPVGAAVSAPHRFRPFAAVVDRGLPRASYMAAVFRREASKLHLFAEDPARAWMNAIEPGLRTKAATVAGYTSAPTLFCLQYLSRGHGLALSALATGPVMLDRIDATGTELIDLRDLTFRDGETAVTWVLTPVRG